MILLKHVFNPIGEYSKTLDNNCGNGNNLKIPCPEIQNCEYRMINMAFIACTLHGTHRCECDKQVSGVNIVTITTAKTFTAGVLLTIVPKTNQEPGIGKRDDTTSLF